MSLAPRGLQPTDRRLRACCSLGHYITQRLMALVPGKGPENLIPSATRPRCTNWLGTLLWWLTSEVIIR